MRAPCSTSQANADVLSLDTHSVTEPPSATLAPKLSGTRAGSAGHRLHSPSRTIAAGKGLYEFLRRKSYRLRPSFSNTMHTCPR